MLVSIGRHNTYLQECTGVRDATYAYTVHDLKHLLLKFAQEKSFSEDSGGGGRESNMHLIPYIMHMALYVMNTCVHIYILISCICHEYVYQVAISLLISYAWYSVSWTCISNLHFISYIICLAICHEHVCHVDFVVLMYVIQYKIGDKGRKEFNKFYKHASG